MTKDTAGTEDLPEFNNYDGCKNRIKNAILQERQRIKVEVEKVLDGFIKEEEIKLEQRKKEEADLIHIIPLIDYIACAKELKKRLGI